MLSPMTSKGDEAELSLLEYLDSFVVSSTGVGCNDPPIPTF